MSNKDYFNDVAYNWDNLRRTFFSDSLREKIVKIAGLEKNKIAADIGAGTGFITEGLLRHNLRVIAVDQSKAMISVMKKKLLDSEVDYVIGEGENLPLKSESVDYVFANMYLHHTENPSIAIEEMVRIIRRGGKLIISDLDEHGYEFLRIEQHDRWLGFRRNDIKNWLESAKLKNINIICANENCCSKSNTAEDQFASISIFIATGVK
ncbi:MAG: class I SAM-dependent methyltransferase [Melioribacter sp.]|nr:class I SAM-dependent methyltransferase [Melioribacter sp.]